MAYINPLSDPLVIHSEHGSQRALIILLAKEYFFKTDKMKLDLEEFEKYIIKNYRKSLINQHKHE